MCIRLSRLLVENKKKKGKQDNHDFLSRRRQQQNNVFCNYKVLIINVMWTELPHVLLTSHLFSLSLFSPHLIALDLLSMSNHLLLYVNICLLIAHSVLGSFPDVGLDYCLLLTNWAAGCLDAIQGPLFKTAVRCMLESEWLPWSLRLTQAKSPQLL